MMSLMEDRRARLGSYIRERRLALRLSEREAAKLADVARNTWSGAEKATTRTVEYVWPGIERALQWAPGSVEKILAGGEPTELAQSGTSGQQLSTEAEIIAEINRINGLDLDAEAKWRLIKPLSDLLANLLQQRPGAERRRAG